MKNDEWSQYSTHKILKFLYKNQKCSNLRNNNNIELNKRKITNKGENTEEERKHKGYITPDFKNWSSDTEW